MAPTKAELVSIACDKCSLPRQESFQIVQRVFQILKETLEKGKRLRFPDLGTSLSARIGLEGEEILIRARKS